MNSRRWVDKRNARNVDLGGDDAHKLLCLTFELEDDSFFHRHFHCRHFNWHNDFFRPFFRLPFHSLLIIYFLFFPYLDEFSLFSRLLLLLGCMLFWLPEPPNNVNLFALKSFIPFTCEILDYLLSQLRLELVATSSWSALMNEFRLVGVNCVTRFIAFYDVRLVYFLQLIRQFKN